jgi:hypothetical protein
MWIPPDTKTHCQICVKLDLQKFKQCIHTQSLRLPSWLNNFEPVIQTSISKFKQSCRPWLKWLNCLSRLLIQGLTQCSHAVSYFSTLIHIQWTEISKFNDKYLTLKNSLSCCATDMDIEQHPNYSLVRIKKTCLFVCVAASVGQVPHSLQWLYSTSKNDPRLLLNVTSQWQTALGCKVDSESSWHQHLWLHIKSIKNTGNLKSKSLSLR